MCCVRVPEDGRPPSVKCVQIAIDTAVVSSATMVEQTLCPTFGMFSLLDSWAEHGHATKCDRNCAPQREVSATPTKWKERTRRRGVSWKSCYSCQYRIRQIGTKAMQQRTAHVVVEGQFSDKMVLVPSTRPVLNDLNGFKEFAHNASVVSVLAEAKKCQTELHKWGRANQVSFDPAKKPGLF